MKNSSLLIMFVLSVAQSNAQVDTIYFGKHWESYARKDAFYYRTCEKGADGKYIIIDHYSSNNKIQMSGFSTTKEPLVKDGHFVYYNENGFPDREGDYSNAMLTGNWKYYYDDTAALWCTCTYHNNKLDRKLISYYKSGKVKRSANYYEGEFLSGKCYLEDGTEIPFTPFVVEPQFDGDYTAFLRRNLRYPEMARTHNVEGRVLVSFVVDTEGTIEDIAIVKSSDPLFDKEVIRLVKRMPKWKPCIKDDKPVKESLTLPINFKLTD